MLALSSGLGHLQLFIKGRSHVEFPLATLPCQLVATVLVLLRHSEFRVHGCGFPVTYSKHHLTAAVLDFWLTVFFPSFYCFP